jgi:hypothetical protein
MTAAAPAEIRRKAAGTSAIGRARIPFREGHRKAADGEGTGEPHRMFRQILGTVALQ